jgi:hypothetical protein
MEARDLEPLMIARPIVPLVGEDLNLGYLISQMIWAIKEFKQELASDSGRWHIFEIEDFAKNLGMSEEWIISQAVSMMCSNSDNLRDQTFFRYESTMGIISLNPKLMAIAIDKMREEV